MKLDTLIVDDEPNARENLEMMIKSYCPELNVVGLAGSVSQAKIFINEYKPKVVFLDIAMPQEDGFELLKAYNQRDFSVIFTTAHSEYALKAYKVEVLSVATDVSVEEECKALIEKALERFGKVDILVNNAGISMRAVFADLDVSVLKRLMDVNFWGTVYCTRYAIASIF